jgi:integrase/recombinase XerD
MMATARKKVTAIDAAKKKSKRYYKKADRPSFTLEELEKFLHGAEKFGQRELMMFVLGYLYGLRCSEIADLRLSDFDTTEKTVSLRRLKGSVDSIQPFRRINGYDVETLLAQYKKERESYEGASETDVLFLSQKGGGISRWQIARNFVDICKAARLSKQLWHPHVLRHTRGQLLHDAGMPLEMIQKILAHKLITSTTVYAQPNTRKVSEVAAAIDEEHSRQMQIAQKSVDRFDANAF